MTPDEDRQVLSLSGPMRGLAHSVTTFRMAGVGVHIIDRAGTQSIGGGESSPNRQGPEKSHKAVVKCGDMVAFMGGRLQVTVDKTRCVGNQMCMRHAPGVFQPDADGKSTVIDVSSGPREAIIEAGLDCPTMAISVVDADTGEDLLG